MFGMRKETVNFDGYNMEDITKPITTDYLEQLYRHENTKGKVNFEFDTFQKDKNGLFRLSKISRLG